MAGIVLPTFHPGQVRIFNERARFNAVRCGRRWGKDVLQAALAADYAAKGRHVGLFAPEHKQLAEPFDTLADILAPIISRSSRGAGMIETKLLSLPDGTKARGKIDFWTLTDNELAGRGRSYDLALINECGFTKTPQMLGIWKKSIRPTLSDRRGRAWAFSTPNGVDPDSFFYWICHENKEHQFKEHHAPTLDNPHIPPDEIELERSTQHPLVFRQEYQAEFVDWSGVAFFSLDKWLVDGLPVPMPAQCVMVFAILDTALKSGKQHDGTAVLYCAVVDKYLPERHQELVLIGYELIQIDADLLPSWMPNVYRELESLAKLCGALMGSKGAIIEDKGSGTVLLQHAQRQGWPAVAVEGAFVALGKDERALSVSSYHHQGLCKIAAPCFEKLVEFKGASRNHLVTQVTGFRLADKDAYKRADDLLDGYTAALSVTFGNPEGY